MSWLSSTASRANPPRSTWPRCACMRSTESSTPGSTAAATGSACPWRWSRTRDSDSPTTRTARDDLDGNPGHPAPLPPHPQLSWRGGRDQAGRRRAGLGANARRAPGAAQGRAAGTAGSAAATDPRAACCGPRSCTGRARDLADLLPGGCERASPSTTACAWPSCWSPPGGGRPSRGLAAEPGPGPQPTPGEQRLRPLKARHLRLAIRVASAIAGTDPLIEAIPETVRRHQNPRDPWPPAPSPDRPARAPRIATGPAALVAVVAPHRLVAGRVQHRLPLRGAGRAAAGDRASRCRSGSGGRGTSGSSSAWSASPTTSTPRWNALTT